MRHLIPAVALALAPVLASAQSPTASRTFAGCDLYACATFTLEYTTSTAQGRVDYLLGGDGALTLKAPIVTGAYSELPLPVFDGRAFSNPDFDDLRYLPAILLAGHAAGDVIPLHILTSNGNMSFTEPVLDLSAFTGALVGPTGDVTGDRVDITLSAVPEPGTLALAAAGLALVGGVVRRRRTTTV